MIRKTILLCISALAAAALNLTACSSTQVNTAAATRAEAEARAMQERIRLEQQKSVWDSALTDESRFAMNIKPTASEKRLGQQFARTVVRNLKTSKFFVHYLLSKLKENDMPVELAAIPMVESGLNPTVRANGGAHGPWQYKRATGKSVGLTTTENFDEIYDFVESTDASIEYLKKLYKDLGNWDLVVAAYNQGEYGVKRAVDAARARGAKRISLDSVRISRGARNYIERFHAFADILHHPSDYGVTLPEVKNRPAFKRVEVAGRISSMREAAELSGVELSTLKFLNNGYRSDRLSVSGDHGLYVPVEHASRLEHALRSYESGSASASNTSGSTEIKDTVTSTSREMM